MDRIDVLVATAQRRLRLRRMLVAIEQNPRLLEEIEMDKKPPLTIPRPVELAGMRARLLRSQGQQKAVKKTGEEYDAVMDGIDEAHGAIKGHVFDLKLVEGSLRGTIESMLERSNGEPDPIDGESDGRQSDSGQGEQTEQSEEKEEPVVKVDAETETDADAQIEKTVVAEPAASWGAKPVV